MLAKSVIDQIAPLLDAGLSQREVAANVGVSRATVGRIARRERALKGRDPSGSITLAPPAVRCPGCGASVYLPCVACQAADYRRRTRRMAATDRELDLQARPLQIAASEIVTQHRAPRMDGVDTCHSEGTGATKESRFTRSERYFTPDSSVA